MNIVDKSPENYYELDITIDGIKRKYIPLGTNRFMNNTILPKNQNSKESWIDLLHNRDAATGLWALQQAFFMPGEHYENDPALKLLFDLSSNPIFFSLYKKYIDPEYFYFNFDIFMDNCQWDVPDYSILAKFDSLGDEDAYYEEDGKIFEIVNSKSSHILNDAFNEFLINHEFLEDFEKDYREIVSFFENYTPNRDE